MRKLLMLMVCSGVIQASDFEKDVALIEDGIVLSRDFEIGRVLVSPRFQGTVMASALDGESLGWINREAVASGKGGVGGADRFWFGPDGSQFTIFFEPGVELEERNWRVAPGVAEGAMKVLERDRTKVVMSRKIQLKNHLGTSFSTELLRRVRVLSIKEAMSRSPLELPHDVRFVGFRVENQVTNLGEAWKAEKGLLSLWSLGTFAGGKSVEVRMAIPEDGEVKKFFTPFRDDQLKVEDGIVRFRCDGNWWSKIGLAPKDSSGLMLSIDSERRLLTVVRYAVAEGSRFHHSARGEQEKPYDGDLANVYNHGSLDRKSFDDPQFYEMESASPMVELGRGESISHWQEVLHFRGDLKSLEDLAEYYLESGDRLSQ